MYKSVYRNHVVVKILKTCKEVVLYQIVIYGEK